MLRRVVPLLSLVAGALSAHAAWNLRHLRTPTPRRVPVEEMVEVLIPARNEAHQIATTIQALRVQRDVPHLTIRVLDDGSQDDTFAVAQRAADGDPRVVIERAANSPLPDGWLGKPFACHRLAEHARGTTLIFVDADVLLTPDAIASLVHALRDTQMDLIAPYPRQEAHTWLERLVQPLLTWSWMSTVPLRVAERRQWASMSAANGQILVFDSDAYTAIDGHRCVQADVLEDIGLMRQVRKAGGKALTVDGSRLASCRMYHSATDLLGGYTKSAWAAFGGPAGTLAATGFLAATYLVPPAAAVFGRGHVRAWGFAGYLAGVAGRAVVARRTGERAWPDSLAHPISVTAFIAINGLSWWRLKRGTTTWKGRGIPQTNSARKSKTPKTDSLTTNTASSRTQSTLASRVRPLRFRRLRFRPRRVQRLEQRATGLNRS